MGKKQHYQPSASHGTSGSELPFKQLKPSRKNGGSGVRKPGAQATRELHSEVVLGNSISPNVIAHLLLIQPAANNCCRHIKISECNGVLGQCHVLILSDLPTLAGDGKNPCQARLNNEVK